MPRYEPMKGRDAQGTRPSPDVAWASRPWDCCCVGYGTFRNALQALALACAAYDLGSKSLRDLATFRVERA